MICEKKAKTSKKQKKADLKIALKQRKVLSYANFHVGVNALNKKR